MDSIRLNCFEVPIAIPKDDGDLTVKIDLTEAVRQIALGATTQDDSPEAFGHVKAFQRWFAETTGIPITIGQADELMDRLETAYADAKKKRAWHQSLPSSTDSIPSS